MTNDYKFDTIQEMVNYLENEYEITILSIRDYGSRAWNLDSETSDMDAGMVFRQKPMDYITLGGYTQNIDRKFYVDGEEFELIGWNIKRFAELLNKSNPSMIEWLNSDLVYYEEAKEDSNGYRHINVASKGKKESARLNAEADGKFSDITQHANEQFKPISLFYHYRSMAKSNYTKYIENRNDLSIKRHLYILRGLTYTRHVEKTHSTPPLNYTEFYKKELAEMEEIPVFVKNYIGEFIHQKKNGNGDRTIADQELWDWMSEELDHKLDNDEHDIRGIKQEKVNELINSVVR